MGLAFSSIPGVGARTTWPKPGTVAFISRLRAVVSHRINAVPRGRTNSRYVKKSASGSATGGTGAGTYANPYLCRGAADLRALLASVLVANCAVYLSYGSFFEADPTNTAQGSVLNATQQSLQCYVDPAAPSTEPPVISGFCTVTGGVTGDDTVFTFNTGGPTCYWVRGKAAGSNYSGYLDQPYERVANAGDVPNTPYSFHVSGTTVTVHKGTHDISTIQFAYATGPGILCQNFDNIGVFDVRSQGWGLDTLGTPGGGQCIRSEATGTNEHLFVDTQSAWGAYHLDGHFVTGSGGITTWIRPRWGLFGWQNANGDGDCHVAYSSLGGQECIRVGRVCTHAGLKAAGIPTVRGQPVYGHGNAGQSPNLIIDLDGWDIPNYGTFGGFSLHNEVPDVADTTARRAVDSYRIFLHNHWFVGRQGGTTGEGHIGPNGLIGILSNFTWVFTCNQPSGTFITPFSAGSTPIKGIWINGDVNIQLTGTLSGKRLRFFSSNNNHNHDFIHCRIRVTGSTPDAVDMNYGSVLQTSAMWNSVVSNECGVSEFNLTGSTEHYREADPASAAGGLSACAFRSIPAAQINGLPGPVTLSAAATWATGAAAPSSVVNASRALPTELACEYDREMRTRNSDPTKRTIGPYEARPLAHGIAGTAVGVSIAPTLIGG